MRATICRNRGRVKKLSALRERTGEPHGTGGRWGIGCTWSSLADLYYQVHRRLKLGEPPEHVAGALDISEEQVGRIAVRMAQWFDGNPNPGPRAPFGSRPDPRMGLLVRCSEGGAVGGDCALGPAVWLGPPDVPYSRGSIVQSQRRRPPDAELEELPG